VQFVKRIGAYNIMIQDYLGFKKQTYHKPSTDTASSLLLLFQGLGEYLEGSIQVVNASPSLSTSGSMQAQVSTQVVNASPSGSSHSDAHFRFSEIWLASTVTDMNSVRSKKRSVKSQTVKKA